MKRSIHVFAAVLLAGSCFSSAANAGWFSSDKPKTDTPAAADAAKPMPQSSLDNDIRQAQLQRVAGNLDGAVHSLAQMMMIYPDDARVVGEYGKVLAQQGRSQDATNFLRRAIDLQPGDWTLYSALGVAYDQMRDVANARMAYERALQLKPGEPAILNNYALSRASAGDLDGAQRMLAQAAAAPNADPKIGRNAVMMAALKPAAPASSSTAMAYNRPAAKPLPPNSMVQRVPLDPQAGPVATAKADPHAATHAPRQLAADAKPKPPAKKKDATPSLRMTADASAP